MTKKILSFLLVLAFMTFFVACDKNETTSSSSSTSVASSAAASESNAASSSAANSTADSSSAASSDTSNSASELYKGDGFSFTMPEGYSLLTETDALTMYMSSSNETLTITNSPNPTGVTTITQAEIEATYKALYKDSEIQDFKSTKIDNENAYTYLLIMQVNESSVYSYCVNILTSDSVIGISMAFKSKDSASVFQTVLDSIKLG